MQMKIGRWEGLYPRIQSAAKHIRCGFVCGYRKIGGPFRSERSAIIGAANPVIGTNKAAGENKPRDRVLTDKELATLWNSFPDKEYGRTVRLLILTGWRRDEIRRLGWVEVGSEERL